MASWLDKFMTQPTPKKVRATPAYVTTASPSDPQARRYAEGALKRAADNIAFAVEGTRNDTLNAEAWSIGQLVKAGHLDYGTVLKELNEAALACGLSQDEIDRTVPRAINDSEAREVQLDPRYTPQGEQDTTGLEFTPDSSGKTSPNPSPDAPQTGEQDDGGQTPVDEAKAAEALVKRFEEQVAHEAYRLAVVEEARRRVAQGKTAETVGTIQPPIPLPDFLDIEYPPTRWVFEGLQPAGTRALLAAQAKSGKTTTVTNLIRALADNQPFLGKFLNHFNGTITLIDDELDGRMLQRWLKDAGITNPHKVQVVSLRGKLGQFNIVDDDTRAKWARHLTGTDYLILDCLRPVLDACGLDENHEAGIFLNAYDALIDQAGIDSSLVVHHMGHGATRSRGDSRIMDWPDALWKLTKTDPDDLTSPRQFEAFGREVNVEQQTLEYTKGILRVKEGRAKDYNDPYSWVVQTLAWDRDNTPTSKQAFENLAKADRAKKGPGRNQVRDAIDHLEADNVLTQVANGYVLNATNPMAQKILHGT